MRRLIGITFIFILMAGCEFWDIDKCLDRGGRWDYEEEQCDFEIESDLRAKEKGS